MTSTPAPAATVSGRAYKGRTRAARQQQDRDKRRRSKKQFRSHGFPLFMEAVFPVVPANTNSIMQMQCLFAKSPRDLQEFACVVMLLAGKNDTFDTNPKRKRGNYLQPSLAIRVSIIFSRAKYNSPSGTTRHVSLRLCCTVFLSDALLTQLSKF